MAQVDQHEAAAAVIEMAAVGMTSQQMSDTMRGFLADYSQLNTFEEAEKAFRVASHRKLTPRQIEHMVKVGRKVWDLQQ